MLAIGVYTYISNVDSYIIDICIYIRSSGDAKSFPKRVGDEVKAIMKVKATLD